MYRHSTSGGPPEIDTFLSSPFGAPENPIQWLSGEIDNLRKKVAEAESHVEEFRSKSSLFVGTNNTTLSNQQMGELQTQSGERSYALEAETIKGIANNGRAMFGFATLVPGVVPQADNGGARMGGPPETVSGFTVNGQRPNSNNVTIDGVGNLDTGDNGGNMATTNLDAVSEFKILTNAYQAEYGRAVGGQMQVVTKSGTQAFHGSGYWYGRRSDWNANTWTNKREAAPPPVGRASAPTPLDRRRGPRRGSRGSSRVVLRAA